MKTNLQTNQLFFNDLNGNGGTAARPPDVLPPTTAGGRLKILSDTSLHSPNFPF